MIIPSFTSESLSYSLFSRLSLSCYYLCPLIISEFVGLKTNPWTSVMSVVGQFHSCQTFLLCSVFVIKAQVKTPQNQNGYFVAFEPVYIYARLENSLLADAQLTFKVSLFLDNWFILHYADLCQNIEWKCPSS